MFGHPNANTVCFFVGTCVGSSGMVHYEGLVGDYTTTAIIRVHGDNLTTYVEPYIRSSGISFKSCFGS